MTGTENRLKMIPLLKELFPLLLEEVPKWDGKVLNKKFYNALTDIAKDWWDKQNLNTKNFYNGVYFHRGKDWHDDMAVHLQVDYENMSYELLATDQEEELSIREPDKAPRVNAQAVIDNIRKWEAEHNETYYIIMNTLNHEEEIKETYRMMGVLAKKIDNDEYSMRVMVDSFKLRDSVLHSISTISHMT